MYNLRAKQVQGLPTEMFLRMRGVTLLEMNSIETTNAPDSGKFYPVGIQFD